ncbi:hypothetical protein BDF19DRAFT_455457 [Syncephalis fuscata]|nr:hypothetical protein BDF19DRAFT_455457 [Syncephalis fuscata]
MQSVPSGTISSCGVLTNSTGLVLNFLRISLFLIDVIVAAFVVRMVANNVATIIRIVKVCIVFKVW